MKISQLQVIVWKNIEIYLFVAVLNVYFTHPLREKILCKDLCLNV